MAIQSDTGWQTVSQMRCYIRQTRVVVFDLFTPPEEIQEFVESYNRTADFGQQDSMWVVNDGIGLTVRGSRERDSG